MGETIVIVIASLIFIAGLIGLYLSGTRTRE